MCLPYYIPLSRLHWISSVFPVPPSLSLIAHVLLPGTPTRFTLALACHITPRWGSSLVLSRGRLYDVDLYNNLYHLNGSPCRGVTCGLTRRVRVRRGVTRHVTVILCH